MKSSFFIKGFYTLEYKNKDKLISAHQIFTKIYLFNEAVNRGRPVILADVAIAADLSALYEKELAGVKVNKKTVWKTFPKKKRKIFQAYLIYMMFGKEW